jgi:hypothetical protein
MANTDRSYKDIFDHRPEGTWYQGLPNGFVMGASKRSWPIGVGLGALACGWTGSMAAMLVIPLLRREHPFAHLVDWLAPALAAAFAAFLIACSLIFLAGRVEGTCDGDLCSTFAGVGPIGYRQRFLWSQLFAVNEDWRTIKGSRVYFILLDLRTVTDGENFRAPSGDGRRQVRFGGDLEDERRRFLMEGLKRLKGLG